MCVYILNVCGYLRPDLMKSLGNLTHLITNCIFLCSFIHLEINIPWLFPRKSNFDAFHCNDVTCVFSENWTVVCKCLPDPMEYHRDTLQWCPNESDGVSNHRRSGGDQRKHQSSASLAFVSVIHRWPANSPHKGPVTRKIFPFDDVIMTISIRPWAWQTVYSYLKWTKSYSLCMAIYSIQLKAHSV